METREIPGVVRTRQDLETFLVEWKLSGIDADRHAAVPLKPS